MPIAAVALLIAAAFGHATWNYLAKGARNDAAFTLAFVFASTVIYLPVVVIAWAVDPPHLGWQGLVFIGVSAGIHVAYYVLLTRGYRTGDLSVVYPLARGTGPSLAVIGAILIYSERPSPLALGGTLLVVAGIIVVSWAPRLRQDNAVAVSVGFALATGAVIAAYTLWDKKGVGYTSPVIYAYGIDVVRIVIFAPLVLTAAKGRQALAYAWREERRAVLGIGLLEPGAYMMVLAALTLAPVSYVAPAREMSILIGAAMGAHLLGEQDGPRRLAGAGAIVAGVFALALG
ncbi:MAG: EamA family transporter [Chloroflexi bacterium]|nr:EamA family transporter [Chloroflexota bacterium]